MRRSLVTLAAAAALIGPGVAAAGTPPVGNFLSLHLGPQPGLFRGAVHSDVLQCIANRKVRIVRVTETKVRVATGRTNTNGHYRIQTGERSGSWFAKVKRETLAGVDCAAAKSKVKSAG